jgi:hypothetical protein
MKQVTMILALLLCAASVCPQQGAQNGVITELTGTVELKPAGQTDFIPAKAGDTVAVDTVVSTGFKSTALIRTGSTLLTVRPLTRLSLSEISSSAGTETLNVALQTGRVRVDVNPPVGTKASMTVRAPIATASVRGTSFEFDTHSLTVLNGTVDFQGSQGRIMPVGAGSSSEINKNGRPADPVETFAAGLLPQPPAGSDAGFRYGGTSAPGHKDGEFKLIIDLH